MKRKASDRQGRGNQLVQPHSVLLATAKAVLTKLDSISQEQKIDPPPEHHFIKADLSLISEAKRVAEAIRTRAGPQGVDYLIMTQG